MPKPSHEVQVGDIFQVTGDDRQGWLGAFVMVTEPKSWGIMGFVHVIKTHDESARAYIRYPWDKIEFVGRAVLVPQDQTEETGHAD